MALHEECATALGEMCMAFQSLENRIVELFASLVDNEDPAVGLIVGSQLPFAKLSRTVEALCRHRTQNEEILLEISEIVKECAALEQTRNTYIHSHYDSMYTENGLEVWCRSKHTIKKGTGLTSVYDEHDPQKLRDLSFAMDTLTRRIQEFLNWLRDESIIREKTPDSPFY